MNYSFRSLHFVILLALLLILSMSQTPFITQAGGSWYVAPTGDDAHDCLGPSTPCATIDGALSKPEFVAGDTIKVVTGTYTGSGAQVVLVNKSATLSGGWDSTFATPSGTSTLDGEGGRRGMVVESGIDAIVERFIIQNGFDPGSGMYPGGAGIRNNGNLTLKNSIVRNNNGPESYGGGIISSPSLDIIESTISDNVGEDGGGMFATGVTTITNSTIRHNTAGDACCTGGGGGGGIYSWGKLTITDSEVSDNKLVGGFSGAGINASGLLILNNSLVNRNGNGEGIFMLGATLYLNNSTVSGNGSTGILNLGSAHDYTVSLNNGTIVGNGGYGVRNAQGTLELRNTLLANNRAADCSNLDTVKSLGHNLIKSREDCPLTSTDLIGLDPVLGILRKNGGPTRTYALLPGSPAIDAGDPAGCKDNAGDPLSTDQRGGVRPVNGNHDTTVACDIGAFEYAGLKPPRPRLVSPSNGAQESQEQVLLTWRATRDALKYIVTVTDTTTNAVYQNQRWGTQYTFNASEKGHTYSWNVQACDSFGCGQSRSRTFTRTP